MIERDLLYLRAKYGESVLDRDLSVVEKPIRLLYVAGPMRRGDTSGNVAMGLLAGMRLRQMGWTDITPQVSEFTAIVAGHPGSENHPDGARGWLDYDFKLVARCDAVLRLPGDSEGADREVALALALGIPVLTFEEAITEAAAGFPNIPGQ